MKVAITGIGVVSPLGCSLRELKRAAPRNADAPPGGLSCDIPLDVIPADKRSRIGRLDRLCRLFLSASYLAVDDARLPRESDLGARAGISFGTALGCLLTNAEYYDKIVEQGAGAASPRLFAYTVSSAAAGEVSIALGIQGPNATHHLGFAAGLGALGYGADMIEMGRADVVLAGGADANGPVIAEALRDMGLLKRRAQAEPFGDALPGIVPSEGAVVAVLESEEHARERGARIHGSILGYAVGFEPSLASAAPEPVGIGETMHRALRQADVTADAVDAVITHAHGTPSDAAEHAAIRAILGERPVLSAPKAVFGEAFGASALLGLAQLVAGGEGSVVMANSLCYSGNVVSLLFHRRR